MSKNTQKQDVTLADTITDRLQYEWAKKRGVSIPLSPGDLGRWQLEMSVDQRFNEMKDILSKGAKRNKPSKPAPADNAPPKLWPLWTHDDVISEGSLFKLMAKSEVDNMITKITDVTQCSLAIEISGFTELSLLDKHQSGEMNCYYDFGNAAIIVSPSRGVTRQLFIGADEVINATLYAGYDIDYEEEGSEGIPTGFLVFGDSDNQNHAVELQEFCSLVELTVDEGYIFAYYSEMENMIFVKRLANLENVNLFSDLDRVTDTSSSRPQTPPTYSKTYLFDRLTKWDLRDVYS